MDAKVTLMEIIETGIPERTTTFWTNNIHKSNLDVIALIPVYNKEVHLEKTLNSLIDVADGVIILDDGSTDKSLQTAKAHFLTLEILIKPPKKINQWDDAKNRYELYIEAKKYNPKWIICIDADEQLESRFKVFIKALINDYPTVDAYAFYVIDVDNGKNIRERFGHRMYRYYNGYTFDQKRLHCRLLPLEINPDKIKLANLSIYHEATVEARLERYNKYKATDPNLLYQTSYEHLKEKLVEKDIPFIDSNLFLKDILEDGLQRVFFKNFSSKFINVDSDDFKKFKKSVLYKQDELYKIWIDFLKLSLNPYHIICHDNLFSLIYAYGAKENIDISIEELLIIEEMQYENNFINAFAKILFFNSLYPSNSNKTFTETISSLISKKIIKRYD